MPLPFLRWLAAPVLCLAVYGTANAWGQSPYMSDPVFLLVQDDTLPLRDSRTRSLSESARRFGHENRDTRLLSIEPILVDGHSVNRLKALDPHGRVRIYIDDPYQPRNRFSPIHEEEDEDWP